MALFLLFHPLLIYLDITIIQGSNVSIQEFKVNFAFSGRQLPKMQSITLGIDDNWGAEYSCLYRFRVHGTE